MNELQRMLDELTATAPVAAADWRDVVGRSRRVRRRRRILMASAAAALIAIATPASGLGSRLLDVFAGDPVEPTELSSQQRHLLGAMANGENPRLTASDEATLGRVRAANLRLIATRDRRSYYVADHREGGLCVTVVTPSDPDPFSEFRCAPDFPSPARPLLDLSVFSGTPDAPIATRIEGFAADGVAAVELVTADGTRVTADAHDNVYSRTSDLPHETVKHIVALNAAGAPIHKLCLTQSGCTP